MILITRSLASKRGVYMRKKVNSYSYPVNVIADYLKFGQDNVLSDAELSLYEGRDDIKNLFEYYIVNV